MNVTSEAKSGLFALFGGAAVLVSSLPLTALQAQEVASLGNQGEINPATMSTDQIVIKIMKAVDEGRFFKSKEGSHAGDFVYTSIDGVQKVFKLDGLVSFNRDTELFGKPLPGVITCISFKEGEGLDAKMNAICVTGWNLNPNVVTPANMTIPQSQQIGQSFSLNTQSLVYNFTLQMVEPTGGFFVAVIVDNEYMRHRGEPNEMVCRELKHLWRLDKNEAPVPSPNFMMDDDTCYATKPSLTPEGTLLARKFG